MDTFLPPRHSYRHTALQKKTTAPHLLDRRRAKILTVLPDPTWSETPYRRLALKGRPPDPWLGFDKVQHATFSFLWTLGSQYTLVNKLGVSEQRALPFSISTGAFIGLAKEFYDWQRGPRRYFSYRDLAANAVGLALATALIGL